MHLRQLCASSALLLCIGCGGGSGGGGGGGGATLVTFLPAAPKSAVLPTAFTVVGTGFAPVGGQALVTFTAPSGSMCRHGSNVTVSAEITSATTIEGTTPTQGVSASMGALVSVQLPGGVVPTGSVVAQFLGASGSGAFVDTLAGLTGDHVTTVSLGDVNGDDHLDLVAANGGGGTTDVSVFENDGTGVLVPAGAFTNDIAAHRATLGDLDGDHDLDAVVVYYSTLSPNVWKNDATGVFTSFGASLGSLPTLKVVLANVDGDQDLDILMGMDTGGGNRVFVNDGTGAFTAGGSFATANATWGLATADFDNDLDLDILAASGGTVTLFLNDGLGAFTASPQVFASSGLVQDIATGDVDGDGDPDAVVVHGSGGSRVYLNVAGGTLVDSGQLLGDTGGMITRAFAAVLGDVDGDCDLDLVFGNAAGFDLMLGDGRTTVFLNGGAGTFSDSGQRLGTLRLLTVGMALGDLNQDGDLDLVTANGGAFAIDVYSNP